MLPAKRHASAPAVNEAGDALRSNGYNCKRCGGKKNARVAEATGATACRCTHPEMRKEEVFPLPHQDTKRCSECGVAHGAGVAFHMDHKIRMIDGGIDDVSNKQTLCVPCHITKTAQENKHPPSHTNEEHVRQWLLQKQSKHFPSWLLL